MTLTDYPPNSSDPAEALWQGLLAFNEGNWTCHEYWEWAGSRDLAKAATSQSTGALAFRLSALSEYENALRLAEAIEAHASALDDVGSPELALRLYEVTRPVFEDHATP